MTQAEAEESEIQEVLQEQEEDDEEDDEDEGHISEKVLKSRAEQRKNLNKKIVQQFADLREAEEVGKRIRKEAKARKAQERAAKAAQNVPS